MKPRGAIDTSDAAVATSLHLYPLALKGPDESREARNGDPYRSDNATKISAICGIGSTTSLSCRSGSHSLRAQGPTLFTIVSSVRGVLRETKRTWPQSFSPPSLQEDEKEVGERARHAIAKTNGIGVAAIVKDFKGAC